MTTTKTNIALAELAEKGADADLLKQMIQYVAQYSSGTDADQLTVREGVTYTTERNRMFQYLSVIMSESDESGLDVDRLEAGLGDFLALNEKWMGLQYFQYQEIPAVGVDSRLSSITGAGLRVVHNPVMDLSVLSGIAFQRETPTGEARRDTETELPVILDWELGIPRYETKLSAIAIFYNSLSEAGRRRFDFRMNLDHELFRNFTIGLHYLYNFDSDPLNAAGDKSSTTTTVQVGYEF